jgi:hypothetical protein
MFDDWELDTHELQYANIIYTDEQKKQLHERKLVEEADNILTKELFDNNTGNDNTICNNGNDVNTICNKSTKNNFSKKIKNELKQKDLSKKIKEQINENNKHIETYGESQYSDNEYLDYEDKFYK